MKADYVYKNQSDSVRVRIHKQEFGWDYDAFHKNGDLSTFSDDAGDIYSTKREAKKDAEAVYGKMISINPETVTEGW